ncbi:MAG TPA: gamma-glutamyltransferase [Vicinamibacterales bacterium]|nr:gamma-glutamyltransferase [Vicinamibacterales bacterium]
MAAIVPSGLRPGVRRTTHGLSPHVALGLSPHVALLVGLSVLHPVAQAPTQGVQDPAWAPDGRQVAVSYFDRIWTMTPDGRQAKPVTTGSDAPEREPAWSPDGSRIAFTASRGEGFDIFIVPSRGGRATAVTAMPGDERWPSWTPDGRLVFAHRNPAPIGRSADPARQWDLFVAAPVAGSAAWQTPVRLTDTAVNETYPRVSPDGRYVAFVSDRDSVEDVDVFAFVLPAPGVTTPVPLGPHVSPRARAADKRAADGKPRENKPPAVTRVTRVSGDEAALSWAPDSERLAFYAVRAGVGSVWVAAVEPPPQDPDDDPVPRPKPTAPPQLVSRAGGAPAWSPDGRTLLVAGLPDPQPVYNGNPLRNDAEPPPVFASTDAFQLFRVPAPLPVHAGGATLTTQLSPTPALYAAAFNRAWQTLRDLYYSTGAVADAWQRARDTYQSRAAQARNAGEFEQIVDEMIAAQPLIKPVVTSSGAVIVSGHPLASDAGRLAIEKGGNIVDAMVAVSFALGVVEPEASGLGGDGAAVLFLKGMKQPTVVEYKDQTPLRATADNPAIFDNGRLVADGPAAANIPGVVGGLDYLYRKYGSGKVKWAELVEPSIALAEEGFILDQALPTSIAVGRQYLEKYPEAARIYLPGGNVPRPGDRFVNKDYAATLRAIAADGADTFYRGDLARKIAADMEQNGGIMTYADLAQYRAMEREPVRGQYRGHTLYAAGPPVPTGIQLFESLQILEHYQPRPGARAATDADYFHHLIEAWKVRDASRRVADPERWPVDFAAHLTLEHARERFLKIDPRRASRYERVPPDTEPFLPLTRIGTGTTSFAVADAEGNMIAVTQTLSTWGGTFYVSKGLGFLYNNHLRSSRTTPGYGSLVPLMRSSTSSVPTLVFENAPGGDVPRLAVGAAGNAWIPVSVYNIITAVVDGKLGAQAAIEAPRFLPGRDPADPLGNGARVEIEDRFPRSLLADLDARGHRFQKIGRKGEVRYGYAAAIVVDPANKRVEGGAEPRRSHAAVAASAQ